MFPGITKLQNDIRAKYAVENQTAKKGQILFVGSSLMEIFPIDKLQKNLGLDKVILQSWCSGHNNSRSAQPYGYAGFWLGAKHDFY